MAAAGSSRQDADHPRQGISIDRGIHAYPDTRRQLDVRTAEQYSATLAGG